MSDEEEKPPLCTVCGRPCIKHIISSDVVRWRWVCPIHSTRGAPDG